MEVGVPPSHIGVARRSTLKEHCPGHRFVAGFPQDFKGKIERSEIRKEAVSKERV